MMSIFEPFSAPHSPAFCDPPLSNFVNPPPSKFAPGCSPRVYDTSPASQVSSFSPPSDWEGDGGPLPFPKGVRAIEFRWGGGRAVVETWVEERERECMGTRIEVYRGGGEGDAWHY